MNRPVDLPLNNIVTPPHIYYLVVNAAFQVVAGSKTFPDAIALTTSTANPSIFEVFPELYGCEDIMETILANPDGDFNLGGITRVEEPSANKAYFDLYLQHYAPLNQDATANSTRTALTPTPMAYVLIFVEDVTTTMTLEQVLVQTSNDTKLLNDALQQSRNYTDQIVTSIADALIVTDPEHRITTINQATAKLFGYAEADLINQPLDCLLANPHQVLPTLNTLLQGEQTEAKTLEVLCQTQDGTELLVALSCSLVQTLKTDPTEPTDTVPNLVYIGRNVTERQRTQQRLTAQYAIARILSESSSLENAITAILQTIGESLAWDIGEFWTPQSQNEHDDEHLAVTYDRASSHWPEKSQTDAMLAPPLQRASSWPRQPEELTGLGERDRHTRRQEGANFAMHVWSAGQPQWLTALHSEVTFGEQSATVQAGFRSAFAFPVYSGSEMLGVMTFFRRSQQSPDERLLEIMTATGNQLGQFIKRKEAEVALTAQQKKTEDLLLSILPSPIVDRLKVNSETIADSFEQVTVMFADLVGFTSIAARLSPIALVERLNIVFSAFDQLCDKHNLEKIKTIGDAYMVVGGLPTPRVDHAEAIAHMALDMQKVLAKINQTLPQHNPHNSAEPQEPFRIRIGINTGSVVAGVIGTKKFIYDLWGDTVNVASRMESHGQPGKIQVTESTYACLRDRYYFTPRAQIDVKGRGLMQTYWLEGERTPVHA